MTAPQASEESAQPQATDERGPQNCWRSAAWANSSKRMRTSTQNLPLNAFNVFTFYVFLVERVKRKAFLDLDDSMLGGRGGLASYS